MSYWNYRIGRQKYKDNVCEEYLFSIIEVYYNDDNTIRAWGSASIAHIEESSDFHIILNNMKLALNKPILDLDNFPSEI